MNLVGQTDLTNAIGGITIPVNLTHRLLALEREIIDPGCAFQRMNDAILELQAGKDASAITIGGITFRDKKDTEAWARLLGGNDIAKYFVDARVQLGALHTRVKTTNEVIKSEANAKKAGYSCHDEAVTSASFQVIYPETIFRESLRDQDAVSGGVVFTAPFSSYNVYSGNTESSTKTSMLTTLANNRDQHQTAIDMRFPSDQPKTAKAHAVCSTILRMGYFQAVGFLESILPFSKMMTDASLTNEVAWAKCLTYCRDVFKRIQEVRTVSSDYTLGSMIHGMMVATKMLGSYGELGWIRHPDVSSALVMAWLQRDGKNLSQDDKAQINTNKADIKSNKSDIKSVKDDLAGFKRKNPTLNK
jgi:hypothetical protein